MERISILLVEDNQDDIVLLQKNICHNETHLFNFDIANSFQQCADKITAEASYDVVFLGLTLPDSKGLETVEKFLKLNCQAPTIILTSAYEEGVVNFALCNGIQDYIVKSRINSENIIRIIEYSITRHRLQAELYNQMKEVEQKSLKVLEKSQKLLTLIKDLQKPLSMGLSVGKELAATPLQPEQQDKIGKVMSSIGVIKVILEDLEEQESVPDDSQDNLDQIIQSTVRGTSS